MILTRYSKGERKNVLTLSSQDVLDDSRILASSDEEGEILISANRRDGLITIDHLGNQEPSGFSLRKAPRLTLESIQGRWQGIPFDEPPNFKILFLATYIGSKATYDRRELDDEEKTFKNLRDVCELVSLQHGFLLTQNCVMEGERRLDRYFVYRFDELSQELQLVPASGGWPMDWKRVDDTFQFPPPPAGYSDLSRTP